MIRKSLLVLIGAVAFCAPADAAMINWGPATTITGASDVSTLGSTYEAVAFGGNGTPAATVNGVTFQPFAVPGLVVSETQGNINVKETVGLFQGNTNFSGSGTGDFNAMSDSNYKTLLSSEINAIAVVSLQVTTSGLTVGQTYQVQVWSNFSANANTNQTSITGGPNLESNTTHVVGGLGQYAIGTFVADGTSQMFEMQGVPGTVLFNDPDAGLLTLPVINAFRIATVPEPGMLGLLAIGATGLLLRRRR